MPLHQDGRLGQAVAQPWAVFSPVAIMAVPPRLPWGVVFHSRWGGTLERHPTQCAAAAGTALSLRRSTGALLVAVVVAAKTPPTR